MIHIFKELLGAFSLSNESRLTMMAGPETHQESPDTGRRMPPDVKLSKSKEATRAADQAMNEMLNQMNRDEAERSLQDKTELERTVRSSLNILTDMSVSERRALGLDKEVKKIAEHANDPDVHKLLVDYAMAMKHADDPKRREVASTLVNTLAEKGLVSPTYVAALEKHRPATGGTAIASSRE